MTATLQTPISCQVAGISDVGLKRKVNEDHYQILEQKGLFLVADGMGGHSAGDIASAMAVEAVSSVISDKMQSLPSTASLEQAALFHQTLATDAVDTANQRVYDFWSAGTNGEFPRGMGTTLVGLWSDYSRRLATVFHVGDSRAYCIRGELIHSITSDHTPYQSWLKNGAVGQAPRRNILDRAIGSSPNTQGDYSTYKLQPEDTFLLCSDGICSQMSDQEILTSWTDTHNIKTFIESLIKLAAERGGKDNATAVAIRFF